MPAPIKVAQVTTIDMGQRYLILNQMRKLKAAGYDVFGVSAAGPDLEALREAGIRHVPIPFVRTPFSPFRDLQSLLALCWVFARERPTIVHTHNPKPTFYAQLAARLVGIPIVVNTVHGYVFHERTNPLLRRVFTTMERWAASWADAILSQNSEDVQTALREGICGGEKISYLGNGIDLSRFSSSLLNPEATVKLRAEIGIPEGCPVIGFIGRLVREKGLLELFQAAQSVVREFPQVRFLIVGGTDYDKPDALRPEEVTKYGVGDSFVFLGHRQDTRELYMCMDFLVLPSHREGFPRTPMEAAAMGRPCILTDIRGCREVVRHNDNGLLTRLGDVDSLAQSILYLLRAPEILQSMGARAREVALERFDENIVVDKILATYRQLLERKGF